MGKEGLMLAIVSEAERDEDILHREMISGPHRLCGWTKGFSFGHCKCARLPLNVSWPETHTVQAKLLVTCIKNLLAASPFKVRWLRPGCIRARKSKSK